MSGLQCHVNTRMASRADGCVRDLWDHVCANSESNGKQVQGRYVMPVVLSMPKW